MYVVEFKGGIEAAEVASLREEISAILAIAEEGDEVVASVESGGGMVHGYGLAASQLDRIRNAGLPLTICVDKVAASGGYMMACVADRIIAAPFAIIGSIGVVAQLPNFNKLLKKHDIDYEQHTAGDFKRTLTLFGENTDEVEPSSNRNWKKPISCSKTLSGVIGRNWSWTRWQPVNIGMVSRP